MSVVLAAIDNSAAARPVLDFARELGRLLGADVETLHVDDQSGPPRSADAIARSLHLPVQVKSGDIVHTITASAEERDAIAVVLGARAVPAGASPAGHVTMELVQLLGIAVIVVPPQAVARSLSRVLVAVEGDGESHALRHILQDLRPRHDLEIIALHVFELDQLPMFGDQPVLETEAWAEEFGRRALSVGEGKIRLEVRVGDAARTLEEVARELDVDLVALAWHRDLADGHGRLVRTLLAEADVPVLLLPLRGRDGR
jgi:nucleotide-binding universal stress UspA family protein